MSLIIIRSRHENIVHVEFMFQSDCEREVTTYRKLIREKKLQHKEVDLLPLGKDLFLTFQTPDLAKSWIKRACTQVIPKSHDFERCMALTTLKELYDAGVTTYEPEPDISDEGEGEV
jgi:hypothetical protein